MPDDNTPPVAPDFKPKIVRKERAPDGTPDMPPLVPGVVSAGQRLLDPRLHGWKVAWHHQHQWKNQGDEVTEQMWVIALIPE